MQERLKSIKAIAKAMKLRLPFEPSNDNLHDLIDAIVLICDEPIKEPVIGFAISETEILLEANSPSMVKSYFLNDNWQSVGIPKRQPFNEQVAWAANKGATKVLIKKDNFEYEVMISNFEKK